MVADHLADEDPRAFAWSQEIERLRDPSHWASLTRERLRALGPTNHPQHGKQAEGGADIAALVAAEGAARSVGRVNLIKRK